MVKDLSEVLKLVELEGDQKTAEDLIGQPIIIESFSTRKSKISQGDFASVQCRNDLGHKFWFNTSSVPVLDCLRSIESALPVRCKIAKRTSEHGLDYYVLASATSKTQGVL